MQAILEKQISVLSRLEELSKQDRLIQLFQTRQQLKDEKILEESIKKLGAIDYDGDEMRKKMDALNTNVSKLIEIIKPIGVAAESLALQEISTKNSMSLPQIARDINVARQNLQEMVRGAGGEVKTGADAHFRKSSENESLMMNNKADRVERIQGEGVTTVRSSLSDEEATLEQNRTLDEQTELLRQIEQNTRGGGTKDQSKSQDKKEETKSGGGFLDFIKARGIGGIAKSAGSALLGVVKRAPAIAAGAAIIGGVGTAISGLHSAGKNKREAFEQIEQRVAAGEISPEEGEQLKFEAEKTATVDRSQAVGGGVGTTGGALAGMKGGAIAGAKLGSFLGPKGMAAGALIGGTVGAISGSKVGGAIGGFVGKTAGKVRNFFRSGPSERAAGQEEGWSEVETADDPVIAEQIAEKERELTRAERRGDLKTVSRLNREIGELEAQQMKGSRAPAPAESSEAGSEKPSFGSRVLSAAKRGIPVVGVASAAVGAAKRIFGRRESAFPEESSTTQETQRTVNGRPVGAGEKTFMDNVTETDERRRAARTGPALEPTSGDVVNRASSENDQARMEASNKAPSQNIVAAPTTINNQTVQNNAPPKLPPRNSDHTINKYLESRYA